MIINISPNNHEEKHTYKRSTHISITSRLYIRMSDVRMSDICLRQDWGGLLVSTAPLLVFLFLLLIIRVIIWLSVFIVDVRQADTLSATWASQALSLVHRAKIVIWLEAGHWDTDSLIFLHHRLLWLLWLLIFNDLLCEVAENLVHSSTCLCTWTEMLAAYI